jgi:hypothetical protein
MSYYDLEFKTETAFAAKLAAAAISGLNIYTGHDGDVKALPWAVIHAGQGEEFPPATANYKMNVSVEVASTSSGTTPEANHKAFVGSVRDAILVETLPADLSAAVADFTCPDAWQGTVESSVSEEHFVSTLNMNIIAANADL